MKKMLNVNQMHSINLCTYVPFHIAFNGMDFEIIRVTHLAENEGAWEIPFHAHENYEFHYVSSGEGYVDIEDQQFFVQKGDFYITAPYVGHRQTSSDDNIMEEYAVECKINFETDVSLERYGEKITAEEIHQLKIFTANGIYVHYKYTDDILDVWRRIEGLQNDHSFGRALKMEMLLLELLIDSLRIALSIQETNKDNVSLNKEQFRLIKIKNYLDGNLCSDIAVQDVAKEFHLSPRQLDRIILKGFGCSFYQYLTGLRMNMAIRLLKQTDDTIMNIAAKSGFSSYQHLYRVLKRNGYDISKLRLGEIDPETENYDFDEKYIDETEKE